APPERAEGSLVLGLRCDQRRHLRLPGAVVGRSPQPGRAPRPVRLLERHPGPHRLRLLRTRVRPGRRPRRLLGLAGRLRLRRAHLQVLMATLLAALLDEQANLSAVERFSQRHTTARERRYRDLIPLTAPEPGEQYAFDVDLDACTGCKACVTACHSMNGL